jgi:hypothetical protein
MKGPAANTAQVLGIRANLAQFVLLVAVNALVGGMLGQERTVLPLLATDVFGVASYTAALTYILAFGLPRPSPTTSPEPGRNATGASRFWSPAGWSPCRSRCC